MTQILTDDRLAELVNDILPGCATVPEARAEFARRHGHPISKRALERGIKKYTDGSLPSDYLNGAFPSPPGYRVTSGRIDKHGDFAGGWVRPDEKTDLEALRDAVASLPSDIQIAEPLPQIARSSSVLGQALSVYVIGDPHIGMLSWADETGEDYDLKIATTRLNNAVAHLVAEGPATRDALIISLGDFFHADDNKARTPNSGHSLDVDTRHVKVLRAGAHALASACETALLRHDTLRVIVEIGNHDPMSSFYLMDWIACRLREYGERVTVDTSPKKFHHFEWGENLICTTHGDTVKSKDLESLMSADLPEAWGRTRNRYWYVGHVHHSDRKDYRGCTVESFRALAATDAWHSAQGYRSKKDMAKIVLHEKRGEAYRYTANARFLAEG